MNPFKIRLRLSSRKVTNKDKERASAKSPSSGPKKLGRRKRLSEKDPEKYEKIKEYDKIQSRYYRLNLVLDAERSENAKEKLIQSNEKAKIRMRRMRARRKETAKKEGKKITKRMTRSEMQKFAEVREKERVRKQKYRANLSEDKKEALRQTDRNKYAVKIRQKKELMHPSNPRSTQTVEEHDSETEKQNTVTPTVIGSPNSSASDLSGTANSTTSAKRKRLSRVRKSMPSNAEKYTDVVIGLIKNASPMKAKALEKRLIVSSKESFMHKEVATAFTQKLTSLQSNSKTRKYFGSTLKTLKKYKLQRFASKSLKVNRKAMTRQHNKKAGRPSTISLSILRKIEQQYEAASTQLADKKAVSKKNGLASRVLNKPILQVYKDFNKANPGVQISRSQFFKFRPIHIKSMTKAKYRGCCCEYCENITIKLKTINKFLHENQNESKLNNNWDVTALTMCKKGEERYHNLSCIQRKCSECGVKMLQKHLNGLDVTVQTSWKRWEKLETSVWKSGKEQRHEKVQLVVKEGTLDDLITELLEEMEPHAQHLFNSAWQSHQFAHLKAHLPEKWTLSVLDFAENYTALFQDEISGAHWNHNQVTIHPIVSYYHCSECQSLWTESMIFISEETKHDFDAVHHFSGLAREHLKTKRNLQILKAVRFSDGCSAQYKSKGPIADIAHSEVDNKFPTQHNYFGSRHGKGPSDGESAVIKSQASAAVKSGEHTIATAWDMYSFLLKNAVRDGDCNTHFRGTVFFVPGKDIKRDRGRQIKTVKGTRSLHSIESTAREKIILTRALSCFCPGCLANDATSCQNQAYVKPWKNTVLKKETVLKKATGTSTDKGDHKLCFNYFKAIMYFL